MKSILTAGIVLFSLIALIVYFGFTMTSERNRSEDPWEGSDEHGSVNGSWGVEIIVEYEDGSTENLNNPLPLEIAFRDEKVTNFRYILSSRGTSGDYSTIEIDMSDFIVLTTIHGEDGEWGQEGTFEDIINLDMDGNWVEVYGVQVDASTLESLEVNRTYNLSFAPSGSITYRGSSAGSWNYIPLPNWFYINFKVRTESDDNGYDPYDDEERWISVEVSSGTET